MSDIFQEVDEEVRRERLRRIWERYGNIILAVALLIVLGIGGWRAYEWWQTRKAAEAGAAFESAIELASQGKHAEAEAALQKIAAEGTSGYRILARLREAAELGERDRDAGIKAYDAVAADTSVGAVFQDLATLRAGFLLVDKGSFEEVRRRLEPLTGADRTFRHTARELIAIAAWRAGDIATARRWFDVITTDAQTPAATRSRIEVLAALAAAASKS